MIRRLTVLEAARALGVSQSTVRRRVRRGELRSMRLVDGGRLRSWVMLDVSSTAAAAEPPPERVRARALSPAPAAVLAAPRSFVRPALPRGTGWCLRHRRTYAWLKSWGGELEFSERFADAFWFSSLEGARRASHELRLEVEPVEVVRVHAA
jgi:excisionase family DNA binding protein